MCTTDTAVLGQVWWNPEEPQAYTDFNTRHICRNFDDVRAWAEKQQLPQKVSTDAFVKMENILTFYRSRRISYSHRKMEILFMRQCHNGLLYASITGRGRLYAYLIGVEWAHWLPYGSYI
jgi:hypothetical protein